MRLEKERQRDKRGYEGLDAGEIINVGLGLVQL